MSQINLRDDTEKLLKESQLIFTKKMHKLDTSVEFSITYNTRIK